jgi:hypothetical protein
MYKLMKLSTLLKTSLYVVGIIVCSLPAAGQTPANYDEAKVNPYQLPDPLKTDNGKTITSAKQWEKQRNAILNLFKMHVYGAMPEKSIRLNFRTISIDSMALGGKAIRKQVAVFFGKDANSPKMEVLLYLPSQAQAPVPVFVGLNFYGNHTVHTDPGINLSTAWIANGPTGVENNKATEASRGFHTQRWQLEELISRGYGLATAYYGDLEPDHAAGWKTGIRTTLAKSLGLQAQEWSAIGAWAWGLSRMMDYLETEPLVNARQVALTGHSRLGKASLWAAASDTRFAIVISNDSGEGGAALARRNYGETTEIINTSFPHWFVAKFKEYNKDPNRLPVDQHMILALMAPRPLYVASAAEDQWADPKGEFLGAKHAEPVYQLFNKKGLSVDQMPEVNYPVGDVIAYHIRSGKHDITAYDWQQYLNFADRHFNNPAK